MRDESLARYTAVELCLHIRRKHIAVEELVRSCVDTALRVQQTTNAFTVIDAEQALRVARLADQAIANDVAHGPLHGIPIAVKDNYLVEGLPTTACSAVLGHRQLSGEATVVTRLRDAGAIIVGKTNMHEWAYGATNEVSSRGPALNPWNPQHITGGSSGGSGAAVAAGAVPVALGSDTGGSIRIPASACGVSGIKPTHGLVNRQGVLPLAWSFDCVGPMARSAEDLALFLAVLTGCGRHDVTIKDGSLTPSAPRRTTLRGSRFGVLRGDGFECALDVDRCFNDALKSLRNDGAELVEVGIPEMGFGFAMWKVIMHAEAAAYHQQFLVDAPELYSNTVRARLEAGRCLTAVEYLRAQQYRTGFNRYVYALCRDVEALLAPTLPVTAPQLGQQSVRYGGQERTSQDALTRMPWLANFAGLPAVSIPCGIGDMGLPVGMSLMGGLGSDFKLLGVAARFQSITDWHAASPA